MFILKRFHGPELPRLNAVVDALAGHVSGYIHLIGSATVPFPEVCRSLAMPSTICRVEGHVGARVFPHTEALDLAEESIELNARRLFEIPEEYELSGQPHSATQANHAAYAAFLRPDDTVMGIEIKDGGHISHKLGLPASVTFEPLPMDSRGIDYDRIHDAIERTRPAMVVAGGSSLPNSIDFDRIGKACRHTGAHLHADLAHTAPFVATRLHPAVFPHADSVTLDTGKSLRGPSGGLLVYRRSAWKQARRAVFPVVQSAPNQNLLIGKACCLEMWSPETLHQHATRLVQCTRVLAAVLQDSGHEFAFGGSNSHLLVIDLRRTGLTGADAESRLSAMRILANRNQIPNDNESPWVASGIRIASTVPAILGYSDADIRHLATAVAGALAGRDVSLAVEALLDQYHRNLVNIASV